MVELFLKRLERELDKCSKIEFKEDFTPKELERLKNMAVRFEWLKDDLKKVFDEYKIKSKEDISQLPHKQKIRLADHLGYVIDYHTFKVGTSEVPEPSFTYFPFVGVDLIFDIIHKVRYTLTLREKEKDLDKKLEKTNKYIEELKSYLDQEFKSISAYLGIGLDAST